MFFSQSDYLVISIIKNREKSRGKQVSLFALPYLHYCVKARQCDALAIGRPGERDHRRGLIPAEVSVVGGDTIAGHWVPYLYCAIIASRGDTFAIGRPGRRP